MKMRKLREQEVAGCCAEHLFYAGSGLREKGHSVLLRT